MAHTCKAAIIHCMDFRIQKTVSELLKSLDLQEGDFDRVSIAGGAANFEQLKYHAELSKKLHNPSLFILTIHEDCGAGAKEEDLKNAGDIVQSTCPECEVKTFVVKLNDTWQEK